MGVGPLATTSEQCKERISSRVLDEFFARAGLISDTTSCDKKIGRNALENYNSNNSHNTYNTYNIYRGVHIYAYTSINNNNNNNNPGLLPLNELVPWTFKRPTRATKRIRNNLTLEEIDSLIPRTLVSLI
jgi:hypothetical protein